MPKAKAKAKRPAGLVKVKTKRLIDVNDTYAPPAPPPVPMRGIVKWFNVAKGFGFLSQASGPDVYVHHSEVRAKGENLQERAKGRNLQEGQAVTYDIVESPKGPRAANVILEEQSDEIGQAPADAVLALGMFGDRLRLVTLARDGTYSFVDGAATLHSILYVVSSETLALKDAVDEFESLLNDQNANEMDFQTFFERHSDFILNEDYRKAHPHIVLERKEDGPLIPDFVLEPQDRGGLCDMLELKLPSTPVFVLKKNRAHLSAAVLEACAQLREYARFFDEEHNRRSVVERYGLLAYQPKLFVVIGRKGAVDPITARKAETDLPGLRLRTYDEVLGRAKARLEAMKKGRLKEK